MWIKFTSACWHIRSSTFASSAAFRFSTPPTSQLPCGQWHRCLLPLHHFICHMVQPLLLIWWGGGIRGMGESTGRRSFMRTGVGWFRTATGTTLQSEGFVLELAWEWERPQGVTPTPGNTARGDPWPPDWNHGDTNGLSAHFNKRKPNRYNL